MARQKKTKTIQPRTDFENNQILAEYSKELETNDAYSLQVDPTGQYHLSESEKSFIKFYIEYRNIALAATCAGIEQDDALKYFAKYDIQQEIKRINHALYLRQFKKKMLSIPELAGFLSSLITDENVPEADKLKTSEKVSVAKYLIELNQNKNLFMQDASKVMEISFEDKVKTMGVESIKLLLNTTTDLDKKKELIDKLNVDGKLTIDDISFLQTLTVEELLDIIAKIEGDKHGK